MKKKYLAVLIIILNLIILSKAFAEGEEDTFSSQPPDVLIIFDRTLSMLESPAGTTNYWGPADCGGTVFKSNDHTAGYTTDCRKIRIARDAALKIIGDQQAKRKLRMGYMEYINCEGVNISSYPDVKGTATTPYAGGYYDYTGTHSGCNKKLVDISDRWVSDTDNVFVDIKSRVNSLTTGGATPLVASLAEAKKYFYNYTDAAKKCRPKFVILITDGDDTLACPTAVYIGTDQKDQYTRRRESVAAAKALYDTFAKVADNPELKDQKIKLFVVGFGSNMPTWSQNTLNWMAYYGHTSFSPTHTGDYNGYKLDTTNPDDLYPYNKKNEKTTACASFTTESTYACTHPSTSNGGCFPTDAYPVGYKVDPGTQLLSGYAFIAADANQLDAALASAFTVIEETYSFATSSVQSVRTKDENYIYEASFTVRNYDPFYVGHLKQYKINEDGTIPTDFQWDAGAVLKTTDASARNIWTYKSGAPIEFSGDGSMSGNINYTDLGVTGTTAAADAGKIITFIRGGDVTTTGDQFNEWKLGDTFHSFPVTIGTPATYFCDNVDGTTGACCNNIDCKNPALCVPAFSCCSCAKAFDIFRGNHQRTTTTGNKDRMIVIGANDGQLHMFSTYDSAEKWSFIPPNLLSRLQYVSHQIHPDTTQAHTYFVDGPISVSDIWFPADLTYTKGVVKLYSDWHTWMVFGEGRGAKNTLWSKSPSCDSNLSKYYSTASDTYPYYCGYYAFDLTNVTRASPTPTGPKWLLGVSSTDAPYLGEPWSKMIMSRVRRDGNENWVGFFGGGYSDCTTSDNSTCATRGKGFFVVDLETGSVIKRFSKQTSPDYNMDYQLPAPPAAIDTDNDSFVDTVYMGDRGNNIWRFKMCLQTDDAGSPKCGIGTTGKWISTVLLSSVNHYRQIFTQASVTRDNAGNMWVYVGTGDKMHPTALLKDGSNNVINDRFYAIKDNDLSSTWSSTSLKNITSSSFDPSTTGLDKDFHGWYIDLEIGEIGGIGAGEKILADPVVFQGTIYFTTYVPPSGTDVCDTSGSAYLYAIDYVTGTGRFSGDTPRSEFIGYGIPSSPIVSLNPYGGTDIYVSTSQKNTETADTFVKKQTTPIITNYNKTNLMMWLDKRLQ